MNTIDPALPSSWIEIHPDNKVLIRTGKSDFGQGSMFTAYRQIVADELSVSFDAIPRWFREAPTALRTAAAHLIFWGAERRNSQGRGLYLPGAAGPGVASGWAWRRTSFP